jgi:hypothetical protein
MMASTMAKEFEEHPSGMKIIRHLDDDGRIVSESFGYGMLDFCLSRKVHPDGSIEETYFAKREMISQARYEKLRVNYPDMPPADPSLVDLGSELLELVKLEKAARKKAASVRQPDAAEAARRDAFCTQLMQHGRCEDASSWIADKQHSLGELSPAESRRLVAKLLKQGYLKVYACEIQEEDDGCEYTEHLVLELPDVAQARKKMFQQMDRIAAKQGYHADFDDGQRYAYLKLG